MPDARDADVSFRDGREMGLTTFILVSAVLYAAAMVTMKFWGQVSPAMLLAIITGLMAGAIWMEIGALQTERLGMVYVLILGVECLLVAVASAVLFGETFTTRELLGGALILAGTAVAWI